MTIFFSLPSQRPQIIFDGFTVGRYDEGSDDNNNDFETVDTGLLSAGGTEACKFSPLLFVGILLFINKINFLMLHNFSTFLYSRSHSSVHPQGPDGYMQVS